MNGNFNNNNFTSTFPVVFNLLLINVIFLGATWFLKMKFGIDLNEILGLHFILAEKFHFYQFFTYMFMHAGFNHIFFNMFAVYMFGRIFEMVWGGKKFLFYYLFAGIGAAIVQQIVWYIDYTVAIQHIGDVAQALNSIRTEGANILSQGLNYTDKYLGNLNILLNNTTSVGASGAVFGILLAFGYMFPQEKLFLFFIPIPIPARIFVIGYGVLELFLGVASFSGDNVAHFAHLGGLLFGLFLLWFWKWRGRLFNRQM